MQTVAETESGCDSVSNPDRTEFICNQRLNKGSCCHVDPGAQSHILCPRDRRLSDAAGRHGNQSRLLCWPCQKPAPFCPDPFHLWRHTFPWGDFAHNICPVFQPPRPTHSRGASGLAFLNKGRPRTHLLRGVRGRHTITIWRGT